MTNQAQLLADQIYRQYRTPVLITGHGRQVLAFSDQPESETDVVRRRGILLHSGPEVVQWLDTFLEDERLLVRVPASTEFDTLPRTIVKVTYRGHTVGHVFMLDSEQVIPDDWIEENHNELTALGLEIELSRSRAATIQQAVRSALSTDAGEQALAIESLRFFRAFEDVTELRVVVAEVDSPVTDLAPLAWEGDMGTRGAWTTVDDRLVLIISGQSEKASSLMDRVLVRAARFRPGLRAFVGVGGAVGSVREARTSYFEAIGAARVARLQTEETAGVASWDELGPWRILLKLGREDALRAIDPRIVDLLERERPQDVRVVREFLERNGDVEGLASFLHLHRSTVYSRIKKVEKRHGLDFSTADDRTLSLMGLRLAGLHRVGADPIG